MAPIQKRWNFSYRSKRTDLSLPKDISMIAVHYYPHPVWLKFIKKLGLHKYVSLKMFADRLDNAYLVSILKRPFYPNSSLFSKINPWNIKYMPAVKFIERLNLE